MTSSGPEHSLLRRSTVAGLGFLLLAVLGGWAEAAAVWYWDLLQDALGTALAALTAALTVAGLSVLAALLTGRLRLPLSRAQLWLSWFVRQTPFCLRDLVTLRRVSRGRNNSRWASQADFEADDPRRGDPDSDQCDFGKWWRTGDFGRPVRLTHLAATDEMVAVNEHGEDQYVELLADNISLAHAEHRLQEWAYAGFGFGSLVWVRQRLAGWKVPLPPHAAYWKHVDERPPSAWPAPPRPSVGYATGSYFGKEVDFESVVEVTDERGTRPLYHAVEHSPTGLAWGYAGSGPTDMARSLLLDRLGYVPNQRVVLTFRNEVVATLSESFVLTFEAVDAWVDERAPLFAADPRAQLLDPFAAGGPDER
jgi:hypothetical protein